MTDAQSLLDLYRSAYAGATRKAARTWALLEQLQAQRLWVPVATALDAVARNVFFNAGYDACERYESIEDFKDSLVEDLDVQWGREERGGVVCYVLRPFFAEDGGPLRHLGLSGLRGCSLRELQDLNLSPIAAGVAPVITGLPHEEADMLVSGYRARILKVVNLLRKLSTALCYVRGVLSPSPTRETMSLYGTLARDGDIERLVEALEQEVKMPLEPAPMRYFGTEAQTVNVLRTLPGDADSLRFLLEA